jgi:hypothetical protein
LKGWNETKCQELIKPYLVTSYGMGIASLIGAVASGQIGPEVSWCGIKEHDVLLHFFLFYLPLVLVEFYIVWAMYYIVKKIYANTSHKSGHEVGTARVKNNEVRVKLRRKTLFRAIGFAMVMVLTWGCELAEQLRVVNWIASYF